MLRPEELTAVQYVFDNRYRLSVYQDNNADPDCLDYEAMVEIRPSSIFGRISDVVSVEDWFEELPTPERAHRYLMEVIEKLEITEKRVNKV